MDDRRFDALARTLSRRAARRSAVLGGLVAALVGLGVGRARLPGSAQDAATPLASPAASPLASPAASPVASPGPLDLLAGTPQAGGAVLGRSGDACKALSEPCATDDECCSGICRFWRAGGLLCSSTRT